MLRSFSKAVMLCAVVCVCGAGVSIANAADSNVPMFNSRYYLDVSAGYAWSNWGKYQTITFEGVPNHKVTPIWDGQSYRHGATYGVDVGYHFLPMASVEAGFIDLPTVKYKYEKPKLLPPPHHKETRDSQINTWLVYGAVKLSSQRWHGVSVFTKAGIAYHYIHDLDSDNSSGYVEPILGVGSAYNFARIWHVDLEYTFVGAEAKYKVPQANLLKLGLGFDF